MPELEFKVVSSQGQIFKDIVDMVVLPSLDGDTGISSSERVFTYILKAGVIYIFKSSRVYKRLFISSGRYFADGDKLTIATDDKDNVYDLDDIDIEDVQGKVRHYDYLLKTENNNMMKSYYSSVVDVYKQLIASVDLHEYK